MPRKGLRPRDRRALPSPDYKFGSVLVQRFINKINFDGGRRAAEKVIYGALDLIQQKTKQDPLEIFNQALNNVRPLLEVKARRVGGATYQVPNEVRPLRGETLAMRWILGAARAKSGKAMMQRLCDELLSAHKKEGASIKKREDTHRMAEANRAFAHYRW